MDLCLSFCSMLSFISIVVIFSITITALPVAEPVYYEDVCEPPTSSSQVSSYPVPSFSPLPFVSSATLGPSVSSTTGASSLATSSLTIEFPLPSSTSTSLSPVLANDSSTTTPLALPSSTTEIFGNSSATSVTAIPAPVTSTSPSSNSTGGSLAGNPFSGRTLYANPFYASEVSSAAQAMSTNAAQASAAATVGTFAWL